MKRFPMYKELQFRITYSLGAVLSGILTPSLGSSLPTIQGYAVKSYTMKKLYNCIVIIRQIKRYSIYKQLTYFKRVIQEYMRLTLLVGDACGWVAPNQRRTGTGTGTQGPPRTGCPGPTQGGVEFPRLGWSFRLSLSQSREGLPSPHLARLVVVSDTRADGPHEPSVLRASRCVLSPPPVAT